MAGGDRTVRREALGEDQVGAQRQVRAVPLNRPDRQDGEVRRPGHLGQFTAGYPDDRGEAAAGRPVCAQFVHCAASREARRPLSSRPETTITTKISTTWSMPYAAAVPTSNEYIRLLISTEIGAVLEV